MLLSYGVVFIIGLKKNQDDTIINNNVGSDGNLPLNDSPDKAASVSISRLVSRKAT